jgi:hypothetical protein
VPAWRYVALCYGFTCLADSSAWMVTNETCSDSVTNRHVLDAANLQFTTKVCTVLPYDFVIITKCMLFMKVSIPKIGCFYMKINDWLSSYHVIDVKTGEAND